MPGREISFFQRYSQPENHVTNNTALLLRHIYQTSPFKLETILRELVDSDVIDVGPKFLQQQRVGASVPDASLTQKGWSIVIETKLGPHLDTDQIARHITGARSGRESDAVFVIGLTTAPPERARVAELSAMAKENGVAFAWRSFAELCDIVSSQCEPHETALFDIIEDYRDFLASADLLDSPHDRIYVVPCGTSYNENQRFGLYYHPPERSYRPFKYIGIYKNRCVSLLGEVDAIAVCSMQDGRLEITTELGEITEAHRSHIIAAIEATSYYDLRQPNRYFLTGGFEPTEINKTTAYGIWGPRYLSIAELSGDKISSNAPLHEVAQTLVGTGFE